MEESRGDRISVGVALFPADFVNLIRHGSFERDGVREGTPVGSPGHWKAVLLFAGALALLFLALFVLQQRRARAERCERNLIPVPGGGIWGICDLAGDARGRIAREPATASYPTNLLCRLAQEKPSNLAAMLRSTWLDD